MIFGIAQPKFESLTGTAVLLDSSVVLKDEPVWNVDEIESEIDNQKYFINRGFHWEFKVKIHLYKYPSIYGISVLNKFNEIMAYLFEDVYLYRHRDKDALQDSSGNEIPFTLVEAYPIYITRTDFKDGLILLFKSTVPNIDFTKSLYGSLLAEDGTPITTESGQQILV